MGRLKESETRKANDEKLNQLQSGLKAKGKAASGPGTWSNTRPGTGKVSKN
jgi:hypothetical protein